MTGEVATADPIDREAIARTWGARIMIAGLIFSGVLTTLDRMALSLATDAIRADLAISDVQIGLIQGLSFAILFSIIGVPLGILADRVARGRLLAGAFVLWTIGTIGCGLAPSFEMLFAARMFVGAGEAAFWPVVVSLVADLVPTQSRGKIIGRIIIGNLVGSSLSVIIGGQIIKFSDAGGFAGVPLLGAIEPWRAMFVIYGATGFLAIALLLCGLEPPRAPVIRKEGEKTGFMGFLSFFAANWILVSSLFAISVLVAVHSYSSIAWSLPMFQRRFDLPPQTLGLIYGIMTLVAGATGSILAGYVTRKATSPTIRCNFIAIGYFLLSVKAILVFNPPLLVTFAVVAASSILTALAGIVKLVVFQDVIPSNMRGVATAIMYLLTNLVGASLGPVLVAAVTQFVFQDPEMVGVSLGLIIPPVMIIVALLALVIKWQLVKQKAPA